MITWIDIMILVILLISVIIGTFRGALKSLYSVGKLALCYIGAKLLSPLCAGWLIGHTGIVAKIQELFAKKGTVPEMPDAVSDSLSAATIWFDSLEIGTVPNRVITFFAGLWDKAADTAGTAGRTVIDVTANSIVNFMSFILVFLLLLVILHFAAKALDLVDKIPVVKHFNRIGGFLLGLARGAFINMVIVSVFFIIAMFLTASPINTALADSILAPYFYIGYIFF